MSSQGAEDGHPSPPGPAGRGTGPVVLGVLSGLAHLGPGFLMLASGLLAPLWAVAGMLLVWALLAWLLVTLVRRRSWWTPAVPLVAVLFWLTVITLGENLLGWTA